MTLISIKRALFFLLPVVLGLGAYLGAMAMSVRHTASVTELPGQPAVAPAVADDYMQQVLANQRIQQASSRVVGEPIVGSKGSTVYLYRISGTDDSGQHVQAFVGVTVYDGQAVNSLALSKTQWDLGGLVAVR